MGDAPGWARLQCVPGMLDGDIELEWLEGALGGVRTAVLWTGRPGLVAPLSYRRHGELAAACAASDRRGWPVRLRRSGGGVVPQGPGILNLSLAFPCTAGPAEQMESVYAQICAALTQALAGLGIAAEPRAVAGSFCDGRFNVAVVPPDGSAPLKVAGTAQYWRRGPQCHAVLAHALIIVDADPAALTAQANGFEAALGSGRRYDAGALTSVAQAWRAAHGGMAAPGDIAARFSQRLAAALTH
jgi:hypothetical protein